MSHQDMLGSLTRVLEGVGGKYLGALTDLANKLRTPTREFWFKALTRMLRLENPFDKPSRSFKLVTSGMDFRDCIRFIEREGKGVCDVAKDVLRNEGLKPAPVAEHHIIILSESEFFREMHHSQDEVVQEALRRGLRIPPVDIALLLQKNLVREELLLMGFDSVRIMHEPILASDGETYRLHIGGDDGELSAIKTAFCKFETELGGMDDHGVIFLAPAE